MIERMYELYNAIDDVYDMGKKDAIHSLLGFLNLTDEQIATATNLTPRDIALLRQDQTPPSTQAHKLFTQGGTNT